MLVIEDQVLVALCEIGIDEFLGRMRRPARAVTCWRPRDDLVLELYGAAGLLAIEEGVFRSVPGPEGCWLKLCLQQCFSILLCVSSFGLGLAPLPDPLRESPFHQPIQPFLRFLVDVSLQAQLIFEKALVLRGEELCLVVV